MRTFTTSRWLSFAGALLSTTSLATAALATDGLALDRFDPSSAGDRLFGVPSPYVAGEETFHFGVVADYAHNPLVLTRAKGVPDVGSIVQDQMFLHLNATMALWHRLSLNIDLPVAIVQNGDSPVRAGVTYESPEDAEFGDIRAALRLRLYGAYDDPLQLALSGSVWFPSGQAGSFVSDGTIRAMPQLIAGGQTDRVVWSFAFGPELRGSQAYIEVAQGTMLRWGTGFGVRMGEERDVQLGPELTVAVTTDDVNRKNTNVELLLGAKYRVTRDVELGAAGGTGLSGGIGTPDARGLLSATYTPNQAPLDTDKDGVPDAQDVCPHEAFTAPMDPARKGCTAPPPDTDRDGVIDAVDACPDVIGVPQADPTKSGCPADADADGVPDALDACPQVAGVQSADPATMGCPPPPPDADADGVPDAQDACPAIKGLAGQPAAVNGCPPDTDGDGVRDDLDACPAEKGPGSADATKSGCPTSVRVVGESIVILQQVQFETAAAKIRPASDALLDEVAGVLKEHPEITKLEIGGHTDARGARQVNKTLSQRRADAVRDALVKRGVDAGRLTAKGYGSEQPIADDKTEEGQTKNRRVEFRILERKSP